MDETRSNGEIMRNALRLVKYRGDGALDYTEMMVGRMQDEGDEHDQIFWQKISKQVELLLYENG